MRSAPPVHAIRAKVYYAESWFDQNEAIILDYRETSLVAHWIRDEIRLVARLYRGIFWGEHKVLNFACICRVSRSRPMA